MKVLEILFVAFAGGVITSFAEFKLKYNLFDYIDDALEGTGVAIAKLELKIKSLKAKL